MDLLPTKTLGYSPSASSFLQVFLVVFACLALLAPLFGCSSEVQVSDRKKSNVVVAVANDCVCPPQLSGGGSGDAGTTSGGPKIDKMIKWAEEHTTAKNSKYTYVWGGGGPDGYDCSGFVANAVVAGGFDVGVSWQAGTGNRLGTDSAVADTLAAHGWKKIGQKGSVKLQKGDVIDQRGQHIAFSYDGTKLIHAYGPDIGITDDWMPDSCDVYRATDGGSSAESGSSTGGSDSDGTATTGTIKDKVIQVAENELGKSDYKKYCREVGTSEDQANAWCSEVARWFFVEAYGHDAFKLLFYGHGGAKADGTPESQTNATSGVCDWADKAGFFFTDGKPEVGDIAVVTGKAHTIGLVISVDGDKYTAIGGNWPVKKKKNCDASNAYYIRPDWAKLTGTATGTSDSISSACSNIKKAQKEAADTERSPVDSGTLVGDTIEEQCWNFYKANGFSDEATAGILGNIKIESNFDPAMDLGYSRGLFSFDYPEGLDAYAKSKGTSWSDLKTVLEYSVINLGDVFETYSGHGTHSYGTNDERGNPWTVWWPEKMTVDEFKKIDDVEKATEIFCKVWERPSIPHMYPTDDNPGRVHYANEYYEQFKGTSKTGSSQTEIPSSCNDEGESSTVVSNASEMSAYHQHQGWNLEQTELVDSGAGEAACGATSFTMGVNVLLKDPKKYFHVDVYRSSDFGGNSTDLGGTDKPRNWLKTNGLSSKIKCEDIPYPHESITVDTLKEHLEPGKKVIVISSGAKAPFLDKDGGESFYDGHFILIYAYENSKFYVHDPAGSKDNKACVEYSESAMKAWLEGRSDNHAGVYLELVG